MGTLWSHTPDFGAMFDEMGQRLAGELLCRACGHREPCDAQRASLCLSRGWPQHCGETMTLEPTQEGPHRAQGARGGPPPASGSPPTPSAP